jgi:anti-sigma regulatory factor (Ser/Thr protein kinase)
VSVGPDPSLVRTVRLVSAAFIRRATADEDLVEEVRLAVGEACALLVGAPGAVTQSDRPVEVELWAADRLHAVVRSADQVPGIESATELAELGASGGVEPLTLLRGMVEDLEVEDTLAGTTLSMSWPLR